MEDTASEYEIFVSTTHDIIRLVEKTLASSEEFQLPDKSRLKDNAPDIVVIDATECEIRRVKKRASEYYSGKKKKYIQKAQIVIDYKTAEILSVNFSGGRTHNFKLFKQSNLQLSECTCVLVDKGYQGIKKIHTNSFHPVKRRKKCC